MERRGRRARGPKRGFRLMTVVVFVMLALQVLMCAALGGVAYWIRGGGEAMFRFTIRDLLFLTLIVAVGSSAWISYQRAEERRKEDSLIEARLALFRERLWLQEEQKHRNQFSPKQIIEARALKERQQVEQAGEAVDAKKQ